MDTGKELRPLSIPAVCDRVVGAAVKLVIEPVSETDFLPCSFGFRPRRSAHDALQVLIDQSWKGRRWALETDIADCFEAIPHSGLMSAIEERVSDRRLLKLLRAMLRAGVMQDGAVHRDVAGTPQGGVVSPVLANVYLHRLDRQWTKRGTGVLVRYADDLVVLCHSKREAKRRWCRFGRSWPSWAWSPRRPRPGIVHLREEARALISSASITVACAGSAATGTCGSSPAGPHERQCSEPAIGSVRSRTPSGSATRSK
jgi:retron-type reverse transcriptase